MSASSILFLVAAGHFVEGLVELRELRDDLCGYAPLQGWRPAEFERSCLGARGAKAKHKATNERRTARAVSRGR